MKVRQVIIHNFLVKGKANGRSDLLITASVNIHKTKIPTVMKTCFSCRKLMKIIWKPSFLEDLHLSTNPLFLSKFSLSTVFVQISKTRYLTLILGGGGGNYYNELLLLSIIIIGGRINVNTNDITFNIEKCKKNP